MNHFNPKDAAERATQQGPDFYSNTIKHIKDYFANLTSLIHRTPPVMYFKPALLEIRNNVYGTDIYKRCWILHVGPTKYIIQLHQQSNKLLGTAALTLPLVPTNRPDYRQVSDRGEPNFKAIVACNFTRITSFLKWLVMTVFTNWFPNVYLKNIPSPPRNTLSTNKPQTSNRRDI